MAEWMRSVKTHYIGLAVCGERNNFIYRFCNRAYKVGQSGKKTLIVDASNTKHFDSVAAFKKNSFLGFAKTNSMFSSFKPLEGAKLNSSNLNYTHPIEFFVYLNQMGSSCSIESHQC